jgi:hypothetical protein
MDAKTALLVFALSAAADEGSTAYMRKHGGTEIGGAFGPQQAKTRLIIKGAMLPLYLIEQKKSKLVRFGVPALFVVAGAWNVRVAKEQQRRSR